MPPPQLMMTMSSSISMRKISKALAQHGSSFFKDISMQNLGLLNRVKQEWVNLDMAETNEEMCYIITDRRYEGKVL